MSSVSLLPPMASGSTFGRDETRNYAGAGPVIRLVPITSAVVRAAANADAFTALTGATLGNVAQLVEAVVAQDVAHRQKTGPTPGWGGFLVVQEAAQRVVGACGFVGAPDNTGAVEIGYGTFPPFERQGFASASCAALLARAARTGIVRVVCAHTLPVPNASTRILARNGFAQVGTSHDDDEGLVWRWEHSLEVPRV